MSSRYLQIKAKTWDRDSNGLFDYDTTNLTESILNVTGSGNLVRKGNEIFYLSHTSSPTSTILLKILEDKDKYIIFPSQHETISLVVQKLKSLNNKGYQLTTGDIIKLGKVKLKVAKISINNTELESYENEISRSDNGDTYCRFCFSTHSTKHDPLLSVCKCAGSMELVHINCLGKYIMSKVIKKSNFHCTTYCWKTFNCDVCKEALPLRVKHEGRVYEVIPSLLEVGEKSMVLEDFRRNKYKCIIHVVKFGDMPVLIGRSSDTDLKVNDISVSRLHAFIELYNDQVYIKDNNSKFGTLIVHQRPIVVCKQFSPTLQVGRSLLTFSLNTKIRALEAISACCHKKNKVQSIPKVRTEVAWEEVNLISYENVNNSG